MKPIKPSEQAGRTAAVLAALGFLGIALFQVALAAGVDWGHAAWGGADAELSSAQRIGSAAAALIWAAAAVLVLGRAGFLGSDRSRTGSSRWGTWAAAALSGMGALANFASEPLRKLILGILALLLAILCVVVARSPADRPRRPESLASTAV